MPSPSPWQSPWRAAGDCGGGQTRASATEPETRTGAVTVPIAPAEESAHPFFLAPRPSARFFHAVLCSTRRHLERCTGRLPTDGEAFGWMLDHALAIWVAAEPDPRRAKRLQREHAVYARGGRRWSRIARGT